MISRIKKTFNFLLISYLFVGCSYHGERLIVNIERGIFKAFGK